jgi:hypothetical protein
MREILSITFMILFTAALAFSPEGQANPAPLQDPGCIVQPDVIEACHAGGGRFDWQLCSCVGGAN